MEVDEGHVRRCVNEDSVEAAGAGGERLGESCEVQGEVGGRGCRWGLGDVVEGVEKLVRREDANRQGGEEVARSDGREGSR